MLLSVQLEPLLEKELEQAAGRLGIGPSQFIVSATKLTIRSKLMAQRQTHQGDWLSYQEAKKQRQEWSPADPQQVVGDSLNGMYDLVCINKGAAS